MQSAFLCTGKTEDLIALGDTGQPVHKAAMQIIAALTRKSPDLAKFLAVPKSNEQGDVIDWYSPVPGEVIPWASATETDRNDARQKFDAFKKGITTISDALVASSDKNKQSDTMVFGKLLGLASYGPDDTYVSIIKGQRINANGISESYNQPVLSFWGFIHNEEDRKREPLYFLAPKVAASVAPTMAAATVPPPVPPQTIASAQKKKPWWLFWSGWRIGFGWLWPLLLLLLLLLLLSLLRGCIPGISLPHFGLPSFGSHEAGAPSLPVLDGQSRDLSIPAVDSDTQKIEASTAIPESVQVQPGSSLQSAVPPPEKSVPSPELSSAPQAEQAAEPAAVPNPAPPETSQPATSPKLNIPSEATENGPAEFLNGQYRAGAGIQDRRTGKPLRLEYAFSGGKGNVTVRRPDGVACTGAVNAAMSGGSLAINSQGQAVCSDGSQYDMPQVNCKPGAQSIADCTGTYGSETFPMSMVKQDK